MKRGETFLPLWQKRKDKQLELVKEQETVQGNETKRLRPKFLDVRDSRFYFREKYLWIDKCKVTHLKYQLRNEKSTDILYVPQVMLHWGQIIWEPDKKNVLGKGTGKWKD